MQEKTVSERVECQSKNIKQWYKRVIRLDRNCRESRKEEEQKKKEEERRIENKWKRIQEIRIREERIAEKEWR